MEIYIDASNDWHSLEPKPSEIGLTQFVNIVIHIRNKYDIVLITSIAKIRKGKFSFSLENSIYLRVFSNVDTGCIFLLWWPRFEPRTLHILCIVYTNWAKLTRTHWMYLLILLSVLISYLYLNKKLYFTNTPTFFKKKCIFFLFVILFEA